MLLRISCPCMLSARNRKFLMPHSLARHAQDDVLCVGFPVGGDTISVTSGVISRIEVTTYTQASAELLGIQIDAAINGGNSGGPAFNRDGECVGAPMGPTAGCWNGSGARDGRRFTRKHRRRCQIQA